MRNYGAGMKIAIIIPPKDFKDESLSMANLLLEKWGLNPTVSSYTSNDCVGYHGAVCKPAINTAKVDPSEFDGILLLDGPGVDAYKLSDFRPLLDLVKSFSKSKKIVAGVGNAIKVIARSNIIENTKIAIPKDEESERLVRLYRGLDSEETVEFDKNILTARDSGDIQKMIELLLEKLGIK